MKLFAIFLTTLLLAGMAGAAEEATAPVNAAAGEQTRTGKIGLKALNAADGVVAVLYVDEAAVELTASGEVATKLEELAKRGVEGTVTGTQKENRFAVTKVAETAEMAGAEMDGGDKKAKKKATKKDGKKKKKKEAEATGAVEKPAEAPQMD